MGRPLAIVLMGLASAVLGVASTYAFPETRRPGLSPAIVLQLVAIFGGMAAMLVGSVLASSEGEAAPTPSELARGGLAFLLAFGALSVLHVPFAVVGAAAATPAVASGLRRLFAWLGRR
jgi:hypothetical protein